MASNPRIWQPLAIAMLACHPAVPSTPQPVRCEPNVPQSAQHPIAARAATLAGDYILVQVRTQPDGGRTSSGRLHLAPLDSTARAGAAGAAVRDLVGWLDPVSGDTTSHPGAASRDPSRPGAVLAGYHLVLGEIGALDGHVEQFTITAVAPEGFWGWWKAESGWNASVDTDTRRVLPDPAGYFCALRVMPKR